MKQIGIKESQDRLLALAVEVANIAKSHGIDFFMVGGTMLGTIRHKGFIPWDDDMDFGVKYSDFWKLSAILKAELPSRYKCVTYEDRELLRSFFFKVIDTDTCIDDPCYNIPLKEKYGLGIDVFPIVSCTEAEGTSKAKLVYNEWITCRKIYTNFVHATWYVKMSKMLMRFFTFKKPIDYVSKVRNIVDSIAPGDKYCNIVSPQFWKVIWPKETFDNLAYYTFENVEFQGPADYDSYLTTCYKNYMQLPPVEKRRVHSDNTYIK